ncbi:hypothetical protein AB5I39_10790 [Sphingomonas sp. MMS24-J45]|uniref:hypothetical protein n=1 Tax=Sphingomonas sp. MMS24-J45 TaxID=3238806 RepID=UPI00384CC419
MADGPQNPNQAIDMMASITTTHLILIVVLAVLTVIGIWWGMRLKRQRKAAQEQVLQDFAVAEAHGATTVPTTVSSDGAVSDAATERTPAPDASAAVVAAPAAPAMDSGASELTRIKGLGPKLAATLAERGITRVDQVAALTPAQAAELDATLGTFQGRMARDRWIEQAKLLAAGDVAGYEAAFGKLGG